jgi:predicted nucleotidyltransferase
MNVYGLTQSEWAQIFAVFQKAEHIEQAVLFGSRAKGTHKPASDIDIALKGSHLNISTLHEIEWQLDDLLLPYKFDLVIFEKITDPAFIRHIVNVGIPIYYRKTSIPTTTP